MRHIARGIFLLSLLVVSTAGQSGSVPKVQMLPALTTHKVEFIESISSIKEFKGKGGFFSKLANLILGPPTEQPEIMRPISVASSGKDWVLVTDLGIPGVHILNKKKRKHRIVTGGPNARFRSPVDVVQCGKERFCVSDSILGKILAFDLDGKFQRFYGDAEGEGFFKRPTGLAFESESGRLYVTDTLRHKVYVLDEKGAIVRDWGGRGRSEGQFNFPTDLALSQNRLYVIDSLNFRIQVFSLDGEFLFSFGKSGRGLGSFVRPKGISVDAEGKKIFVADGWTDYIQAFSGEGLPLFAFGGEGNGQGRFQIVSGISVDSGSRIIVADSMNRRIQFFRHQNSQKLASSIVR